MQLDGDNLLFHKDSLMRSPADFDSLKGLNLTRRIQQASGGMQSSMSSEYDSAWYSAVTDDEKWFFPKIAGRISLYTNEPGTGTYSRMDLGKGLTEYQEKEVRKLLSTDNAANKHLRTERNARITGWGMLIGGAGLTVVGFVTSFETKVDENGDSYREPSPGPLFFLGVGTMVASWVPSLIAGGQYEAAIKAYNKVEPAQ